THVRADGTLVRASEGGVVSDAVATLEDHGAFASALLVLGGLTGEARFVRAGLRLVDATVGPDGTLRPPQGTDPVLADLGPAAGAAAGGARAGGAGRGGGGGGRAGGRGGAGGARRGGGGGGRARGRARGAAPARGAGAGAARARGAPPARARRGGRGGPGR